VLFAQEIATVVGERVGKNAKFVAQFFGKRHGGECFAAAAGAATAQSGW
jgi:hypothetical protein